MNLHDAALIALGLAAGAELTLLAQITAALIRDRQQARTAQD